MLQNEKPPEFSTPAADQFRKKKFNPKALIAIAAVIVIACSSFLIVNGIQKNKLQKKLMRCDWYSYQDGSKLMLKFDEYGYDEVFASTSKILSRSAYKPISGSKIKVTEKNIFVGSPYKVDYIYKITFDASMSELTMTCNGESETWHKD